MSDFLLTCDREDGLIRAAVWRDGKLCDLYFDKIEKPDLSGAILRARAVRVKSEGKAAWFDAGLEEKIYLENIGALRAGDVRVLRVRATRGQGKASSGVLVDSFENEGGVGLIVPPPLPWQRALEDLKEEKGVCRFAALEDWQLGKKELATQERIKIEALAKEAVHPDLSDLLEELSASRVFLSGGGEIVIEQTEALVAIDVNAGEASNPTSVNLAAMHEVARQIRLRNLGGIIVIDALKMKARADKFKLLASFKRASAGDPAGVNVFGLTKLGLVELTRARRGPSFIEINEK
ncbi:MAG TPA: hypothetical protein DD400_01020 [Rhodospirillaceae bacterium]|nr:hypothetical protein [Rhodospirillaceae bacterium]